MSLQHLDPLKVSLVTGVVSSSYFIFGNFGAANFGVVPAIRDADGVDMSVALKVALWKWSYERAKLHMAGSAIISTMSFSAAAFFSRSRCMQYIMLGTASLSFAVIPWTVFTMLSTNNELGEMVDTHVLEVPSGAEPSPDQALLERRAMQKIDRWTKLHVVRMVLGTGAWIGGLLSFSYGV